MLTDLTTSEVIDSETQLSGHGHGHPHQATTECTGVVLDASAPAKEPAAAALPS